MVLAPAHEYFGGDGSMSILGFSKTPVVLGFYLVIVYIFYPSGAKYFKKREYQKGIDEFQYIKKIILVRITILSALLIVFYSISSIVQIYPGWSFFPTFTLIYIVVGGFLRIGRLIIWKEFRFYFAMGCFNIIPHNEEFDQMRYLRLGLDSYNKYLRRRVKYQIVIILLNNFIPNIFVQLLKKGMK